MQRISASLLVFLVAGMVLFSANDTRAKEYLGFSPGTQSWDEVALTLKTANAVYEEENYSYKGYGNILPIIKVNSYEKFNKFGQVKESWLDFTPDRKLYRISVTSYLDERCQDLQGFERRPGYQVWSTGNSWRNRK